MKPLEKSLRNRLEHTIKEARETAETAAKAILEQLGVGEAAVFAHLNETERDLRRRLRVHGRQLGDRLNGGKEQSVDRLVEEIAYEHWHRMLFSRFLAENNLLMYPDPDDPVPVTLAECEDLTADEGGKNGWELAARFASRMLPQIFRLDSPVFELELPPEHQQRLESLVAGLPQEVFTAADSLGWVYQFWQAKRKDEVNASGVKIGARELPAVTQLFTEPYMVSFLLDNSLGAWWAARSLSEEDLKNAISEEALRQKATIPGVPLKYLRFIQQDDGNWTPAAGTFADWPESLSELKTLDPCCGSGHFLVAALQILVPNRLELEGLSPREAVDAVLRNNLHGLEIDQRCVELAAFALALTAWKYPDAGGYRQLPELNVACSGLAVSAKRKEWLELAGDNTNLRLALEELYNQFKDAPVLGSLINPKGILRKGSLFELKWEEVGPLLTKALAGEKGDEKTELGVVAKGLVNAATILASKYDFLITNVPYLARGKQNRRLQDYSERYYKVAKSDLATTFLMRCLSLSNNHGVSNLVIPQSWLSQVSYKSLRRDILENQTLRLINRLGKGAFETISGEVVNVILLEIERASPSKQLEFCIIDADKSKEKNNFSVTCSVKLRNQNNFLNAPDSIISFSDSNSSLPILGKFVSSLQGIKSGDDGKFCRVFWELYRVNQIQWRFEQSTTTSTLPYAGRYKIINWELRNDFARLQGNNGWGKFGIIVNQMANLFSTIHTGHLFDGTVSCLVIDEEKHFSPIFSFCSSAEYIESVRAIESGVAVANSILAKVPFDLDYWTKVAAENYPNGLPHPYSDDPTQWIFHGHPCGSVAWDVETKWTGHGPLRRDDTVLQIAVARLLGYRWPAELDEEMELAAEQRQWVKRCESLLPYADEDGIVCIPPVRGEAAADDRLLNLLAAAYGESWKTYTLARLLASSGYAGKTLGNWLREKFFIQHCKLFHHRPFIWHIWDGLPDGFAALVNYHKLDYKLLETLIYTYLGDWIARQQQDIANGIDGAVEKLAAAENLKKKLELILEGEEPYDIFIRWKPLDQQPLGWQPDLNDGVRLNIRPFMTVGDVRKKGAGVLRDKPNIHWKKGRGKDVKSSPWYHLGPQYGGREGDRINDHHLTLEEKRKARQEAGL